jgi:hypothetical protein
MKERVMEDRIMEGIYGALGKLHEGQTGMAHSENVERQGRDGHGVDGDPLEKRLGEADANGE